jgi:hypothetical protein
MGDDPSHYSRFAAGDKLMSLWKEHDPQGKIKVTKSLQTGFQQTADGVLVADNSKRTQRILEVTG